MEEEEEKDEKVEEEKVREEVWENDKTLRIRYVKRGISCPSTCRPYLKWQEKHGDYVPLTLSCQFQFRNKIDLFGTVQALKDG